VAAGELLLTLSDVQLNADQNARQQQILALDARAARLLAQASGKPSQFSRQVMASAPDLMAAEQATLVSKKLEQESQISVLNSQIEQKRRELEETQVTLEGAQKSLLLGREERATIARLVERGLEPRLELVRADRALVEQESRVNVAKVSIQRVNSAINEIVSRQEALTRQFRSEALNELNRTLADLGPLKQAMPAIEDKILRADIKSPMKGIVNRVFVTTIGGIVKPGDPIMEVVPADDELVPWSCPRTSGSSNSGKTPASRSLPTTTRSSAHSMARSPTSVPTPCPTKKAKPFTKSASRPRPRRLK
jgi:adhesin transport system membrane fusion protein